jgi:hypothetical protein
MERDVLGRGLPVRHRFGDGGVGGKLDAMADMALVIGREVGGDAEQEAARIVDRGGVARVRRTQLGFRFHL